MRIFKVLTYLLAFNVCTAAFSGQVLEPVQYLDTTGARDLVPFTLNNEQYIAAAQLAKDIPDTPANMNGGDADVDVVIFKKTKDKFIEYQRIPGHGNESANFFTIGDQAFLAVASVQSGPKPPFNFKTYSMIYRWDGHYFYPVQQIATYAAKQAYSFTIEQRHFLAFANGVLPPGAQVTSETNSNIYEWNGKQFVLFQTIPSSWGYSFYSFKINNVHYLTFADHLNKSTLYRWDGHEFKIAQEFPGNGGRGFEFFTINDEHYLAYANLITDSILFKWDGTQFKQEQVLEGSGGRNFTYFQHKGKHYLLRINFITGGREKPKTDLQSPLYQWENNKWVVVENIPTFGGVSANLFQMDNALYIAVANSLSKDIRFKVDSVIYKVD